jgi:hypothetical protein
MGCSGAEDEDEDEDEDERGVRMPAMCSWWL